MITFKKIGEKRISLRLALGLLGVLLVSCQSRIAPEVHYYILQAAAPSASARVVLVDNVKLPAYLLAANLMMEVSETEVRPAQYHLWREPLEEGIRRVLSSDLSGRFGADREGSEELVLDLEIETFHGTESGRVVLKGSWATRSGTAVERKGFLIETKLSGDGYAELVRAHVAAIGILAGEIASRLSE